MTIDYSSIATNSVVLAAILIPLLQFINQKSQTYYIDLMALPFVIFLITAVTSSVYPNEFSVAFFSLGIAVEIVIYGLLLIEKYYFGKYRVTVAN